MRASPWPSAGGTACSPAAASASPNAPGPEVQQTICDIEQPILRPNPFARLSRPVARRRPFALAEQQIAIQVALQRIEQRIVWLQFPLPLLGVGEQRFRFLPPPGGMQRIGLGRAIVICQNSARIQRPPLPNGAIRILVPNG